MLFGFGLNILAPFYSTSNFACFRDEGEKWLLPNSSFLRMEVLSFAFKVERTLSFALL